MIPEPNPAIPEMEASFTVDIGTQTVQFTDGTSWICSCDSAPDGRMTPEAVVTAAVRHFLRGEHPPAPQHFRSLSTRLEAAGIRHSIHSGDFDPILDATWECWIWMVVPPGWDFFPDYATVYVRDNDGLAWTLERQDEKRCKSRPSYELEKATWYGKPKSHRRKRQEKQ